MSKILKPSWKVSNWRGFYFEKKDVNYEHQLSLTFKFEDENVAYDKHVQRCTMIKDLIVEFVGENFYFFGEIAGRNGYTFGYRFAVANQEMMSFDMWQASNMGLFVEFKATGPEEFLARSDRFCCLFKG